MQLFVWIFFYVSRIIKEDLSFLLVTYSLPIRSTDRYFYRSPNDTPGKETTSPVYIYMYLYIHLYIYINMYISHENEWHCRLKNTHDGRIGCSERRPAAAVGGTLGDGLSHRFSHTPSSIQAGAEDGRAAPRIADLTARCTESSDFRVSLAPIVALQALYLVHATRLLQLIKSNTPVRFVPPLPQLNQSARKKNPNIGRNDHAPSPLVSKPSIPKRESSYWRLYLKPRRSMRAFLFLLIVLDASKDLSPSTISTIRC